MLLEMSDDVAFNKQFKPCILISFKLKTTDLIFKCCKRVVDADALSILVYTLSSKT